MATGPLGQGKSVPAKYVNTFAVTLRTTMRLWRFSAKMRRKPVWALSEQNKRWGAVFGMGGEALQNIEGNVRAGARCP
jgi:hypothetical protein